MSPLPPIAHLLGLLAGVFGGLALMAWAAPDLPSGEPGVEREAAGDAPESLLSPAGFATGLAQLRDQLAEGQTLTSMRVTETGIESESGDGGVDPDDVSTSAPYLIAYRIAELRRRSGRPGFRDAGDLQSLELEPEGRFGRWVATLRPGLSPPLRYVARFPSATAVAFQVEVRPLPASP